MNAEQARSVELKHSLTPEQQQVKDFFQERIDALKKAELATKAETQKVKKEILTEASLSALERKVQALDGKHQEQFQTAVEKIEAELQTLESARSELSSLRFSLQKTSPDIGKTIQKSFPKSSKQANAGRLASYEAIANIEPKKGENAIANFFAKIVEKLIA